MTVFVKFITLRRLRADTRPRSGVIAVAKREIWVTGMVIEGITTSRDLVVKFLI